MAFWSKLKITDSKDEPVDIRRRSFLFGAVATALVVAAPKSFFIIEPPKLIVPVPKLHLDLPLQQMLDVLKKLDEQVLDVTAIPRWLVTNKEDYDLLVGRKPLPEGRDIPTIRAEPFRH